VIAKAQAIYAAVRRVPKGKVATYGQIARVAGLPRRARLVGYALAALERSDVPWHRVVNAAGKISERGEPMFVAQQRAMLEREGVEFTASGRIPLARYQWKAQA